MSSTNPVPGPVLVTATVPSLTTAPVVKRAVSNCHSPLSLELALASTPGTPRRAMASFAPSLLLTQVSSSYIWFGRRPVIVCSMPSSPSPVNCTPAPMTVSRVV